MRSSYRIQASLHSSPYPGISFPILLSPFVVVDLLLVSIIVDEPFVFDSYLPSSLFLSPFTTLHITYKQTYTLMG
jgi:hypothetical protein